MFNTTSDVVISPCVAGARFNTSAAECMTTAYFSKPKNLKIREASTRISRETFDPTNKAHRKSYANFVATGSWDQLFYLEDPHLSVPHTIMSKLALHAIRSELNDLALDAKI